MKSNYNKRKKSPIPLAVQMRASNVQVPASRVREAVQIEWNKRYDELYSEIHDKVKRDIIIQVMATVLCYLNKKYRWGAKVLTSVLKGTESLFMLMSSDGIMGRPFTTDHCIEYIESLGVSFKEGSDENKTS